MRKLSLSGLTGAEVAGSVPPREVRVGDTGIEPVSTLMPPREGEPRGRRRGAVGYREPRGAAFQRTSDAAPPCALSHFGREVCATFDPSPFDGSGRIWGGKGTVESGRRSRPDSFARYTWVH